MIELVHIAKSFRGRAVLADVSLRIARGDVVCLHGPSGCGKTTLLEITAGLLKPDAGERRVGAERLGYAFQDDCLVPWLTLEENLALGLSGRFGRGEVGERATEWLGRMGLLDAAGKKPLEISGGMKRRLTLARAMAVAPDLLLLDEPFAFQDEPAIRLVKELVSGMNRAAGTTVLLVTHDLAQAEQLGGRIVRILETPVRLEA